MKINKTIRPHMSWFYIWLLGFSLMLIWCSQYLFEGSFARLKEALLNSFFIAVCSVFISLLFSWLLTLFKELNPLKRSANYIIDYLFNMT